MSRRATRLPTMRAGALNGACPACYSTRQPLLWGEHPTTGVRTYRCVEPDCGGRWEVNGVQASLDLGSIAPALTLTLTITRTEPAGR